jgi:hypothetical protein
MTLTPPIRTVSLEQTFPLVIRVHNRHLACLKGNPVPFIPVSHVWHESIANANLSCKSNPAAIDCLYYVLSKLLPTLTTKFRSRFSCVEVWHDYISIPQWQRSVQQTTLLMLPEIFRTAPFSLIYLDDVSSQTIAMAACEDTDVGSRAEYPSLRHFYREKYAGWAGFFRARWFQRMWVSLEYAYSCQACVYTLDNVILCNNTEGDYDSFSHLFEGLQQNMRTCIEQIGLKNFNEMFEDLPVPLLGPLADMRRNVQNNEIQLSFGEALSFVAGRKCLTYRDRFLAISGFLNIGNYADVVPQIPLRSWEACLWLARKCIQRGDYSPLLILRRKEYILPRARWLVGHEKMSYRMWDLGAAISPGDHRKAIVNDRHIVLQLDFVGTVEKLHIIPFEFFSISNHMRNFDYIVEIIISHYGRVDIIGFLNTLERVYAVSAFLRPATMPNKLSAEFSAPSGLNTNLENLLEQHLLHPCGPERLKISEKIAQLLRFEESLKGAAEDFTRLSYGSDLSAKVHGYNDAICNVRCPLCAQLFLYRVQILAGAEGIMHLYRFPGLDYASSMPDGVGLLILEKEIIGRMIFGTPACMCKDMKRVEVC